MKNYQYRIEHLGCPNCAAKMQGLIQELNEVEEAVISFEAKSLSVTVEDSVDIEALEPKFQELCASVEEEVLVVEAVEHDHDHHDDDDDDDCCCGHDHHHDDDDCCCGHDHHDHHHDDDDDDDDCCCGHDHHHDDDDDDDCCCGHDHHDHHHDDDDDDDDDCCCGHDHHDHHEHDHDHQEHNHEEASHDFTPNQIYNIENLGCANCAAKMEAKIRELPEVEDAVMVFATKQLRIKSEASPETLIPKFTEICNSIEENIIVTERKGTMTKAAKKAQEEKAEKESFFSKHEELIKIIVGGVLYLGVVIFGKMNGLEDYTMPMIACMVAAYLILGYEVLWTAGKNILHGQVFDENFLMAIATLGAFAIQEFPEAVGVMLFFDIGELFQDIAVERSRSQIMDAVDLRPEVVSKLCQEDGDIEVIAAEEARIGDILLVKAGERVPLDGVIVEGESRLDTSAITGEPVPVAVGVGSKVTSGAVNTSGLLKLRVEKELSDSFVSRILDSVENAAASKPKMDTFITKFARVYTPIVCLLALITAVGIPFVTGQEFYPWIYTALTFLVMSCPCALVLSVPLAFFCGIGAGSKRGILFKGGIAMEGLSEIHAVVMDKTGTVTKGNFVVQSVEAENGFGEKEILALAASCELSSNHPIAQSIVLAAKEKNIEAKQPSKVEEIAGKGIRAELSGQTLLCGNAKLLAEFGVEKPEHDMNGTEVYLIVDERYAGRIVIADTIKDGAKEAIDRLKKQGIKTAMLTGDAEGSANAVAAETGIEDVYAKLMPDDKLTILQKIREKTGSVMFVGDGFNDAPVLAGADVGAAMGSGADAAIEAADLVFMNSNVSAIPEAIALSKKTMSIARQNVVVALAIKIAVLILGITGIYANMWLAVFADTGVAIMCILNSIRALRYRA